MSEIDKDYLPPQDALPEKIYTLPEIRYSENLNVGRELLDKTTEKKGDKTAIYYKDKEITYLELQKDVNRLANALSDLGIEENDRMMLRTPNIPEYLVSNLACWKMQAIPVLVNPMLRKEEISYRANDSEAKAIIVDAESLNDVEKAKNELDTIEHIIVIDYEKEEYISFNKLMEGKSSNFEAYDSHKDDIARLIYTSGTTGKPKGVISTHADLLSSCGTHGKHVLKLHEEDVIGGHPSVTFSYGAINFCLYPWYFGASLSLVDTFSPEKMYETIEQHGITVLCCIPTAYKMMLSIEDAEKKYDLRSLRICESAGEWLPNTTYKEWKKRFGVEILDSLGSSELIYFLSTYENVPPDKIGSTGTIVPGYNAKIVDEGFNEVPRGTVGRLIIKGPVGNQYWKKPEKQRESTWKGWSLAGLLYVEDEDGYFWYKGRDDTMIVSAGYKIPGGEVENALNSHPAVLESAIVPSPHELRGSIVKAYIVLNQGYEPSNSLKKELQDFVKQKIEPYKYPREIEFVEKGKMPKTSTGKIQRFKLKEKEKERKT